MDDPLGSAPATAPGSPPVASDRPGTNTPIPHDPDITLRIWDGAVPIRFRPSPDSQSRVEAHHMLAPRLSYLPLLTPALRTALLLNPNETSETWYTFAGQPLRWHLPIGLLYDLWVAEREGTGTDPIWEVEVHTGSNFPADKILRTLASGADPPQDHFMAQIKEADHIRSGNTKRVMAMPKETQQSLWTSLTIRDHAAHHAAASTLHPPRPRACPVRCHVVGASRRVEQDVVAPDEELVEAATRLCGGGGRVVLHGVEMSRQMQMTAGWAARNACYADGFVHVVFVAEGAS